MTSDRLGGFERGERGRGDEIACVEAAAVLEFGLSLDFDDGGDTGRSKLAGKAAGAAEPIDLVGHRDVALLDVAVPFIGVVGARIEDGLGDGGIARDGVDRRDGAVQFRKWCDEADLPNCSAHGLRKAGAAIAAENGATEAQLMAIFGGSSLKEASRYTRAARRKKLAGDAMGLIAPERTENGSPAPNPAQLQGAGTKGKIHSKIRL